MSVTTVKGTLSDIRFRSEETGFTVGNLRTQQKMVCVVGRLPAVPIGSYLAVEGHFVTDEKYGEQLKVKSFQVEVPSSAAGIIGYLEYMPNIGKTVAVKLVKHFGEKNVLKVIEGEPERLAEVAGITPERAKKIQLAYMGHGAKREILVFLKRLQLSDSQINRVLRTYNPREIYDVFKRNPYQLIDDVDGFGFKIVDAIAIRNGYDRNGLPRAKAAVRHVLKQASNEEGHCYLPWGVMKYRLGKDLEINTDVAHRAVELMRDDGHLVIEEESKIYAKRRAECEQRVANILGKMVKHGER